MQLDVGQCDGCSIGTDAEIYLDTGILSGADIVAAIALGADACLVGRAGDGV